jgi:hypothetical protein
MYTKNHAQPRQGLGVSHKVWMLLLLWLAYSVSAMAWHALNDPMWMNSICGTR